MTDDTPQQPQEASLPVPQMSQEHRFHSPLNSNAVVTLTKRSEESQLLAAAFPLLEPFGQAAGVFLSSEDVLKIRFVSKEQAQEFVSQVEALDGASDELFVMVEHDALTHPGNIYVRGLVPELTTPELHSLFAPFGEITSCKIVADEYGRSRGYGFVNFADGESADEAIEKLNGLLMNGSKLFLNHHIAKKERLERLDFERANFTNLYVSNFPETFDEEKLRELFEPYGEIVSIFIPDRSNNDQPESRHFGFVNMKSHDDAVVAMKKLDHKEVETGVFISVSRAQRRDERSHSHSHKSSSLSPTPIPVIPQGMPPHSIFPAVQQIPAASPILSSPPPIAQTLASFPLPGPHQQQSNLYVKNLPQSIDDDKLFKAFGRFGIIVSAKTMTNEQGLSRGFGFVCFKTMQEAANALVLMDGQVLDGQVIHVSYAQRNNKRGNKIQGQPPQYSYYAPPPPPPMRQGQQQHQQGQQFFYPQQIVSGNGYLPVMGRFSNGNGYLKNNGYKKRHDPKVNNSNNGTHNNSLSEKDRQTVELSAEIATLPTEQDKRAKFIDTLVAPSLSSKYPQLAESQLFEKCDEVVDKILEKYSEKQDDEDIWLDVINDWSNEDGEITQLMAGLEV